jgi:hypothetical protein
VGDDDEFEQVNGEIKECGNNAVKNPNDMMNSLEEELN